MPHALSIASVRHRVLRCGARKFDHSDFFLRTRAEARAYRRNTSPKKGRGRFERHGEMLFPFQQDEQGSRGEARRTTKRSSGKSRLILSGGPEFIAADQIGVEAAPTFALRQREAYLSFLRCSFSRLTYLGRALPSYMKVIGLGPRM